MMMYKEIKISLRFYKIAYAVFLIAIFSVIRGVTVTYEVGIAMEPLLAILAAAFCADTYAQEVVSKRSEVQRLYPIKKRICSIAGRMLIQELFLFMLAAAGYGLFLIVQRPMPYVQMQAGVQSEIGQFLWYLFAVAVTVAFWGMLSNTISCICRSMWAGIGGSLLVWMFTNSGWGNRCFGTWNLFSYMFRNMENSGDFSWLRGKFVCICMGIVMAAALPKILEKRG